MRDIPALVDTWGGVMKTISILSRSRSQRKICLVHQAALTALICAVAATASAQQPQPSDKEPPRKETPLPAVAQLGPAREIKLAENTWFRFGAQVQAWFKAAQDRIIQPDGSDGGYAWDFYCRRCRFFATGSVVKNVYFNVLFEAANVGRADPLTGVKGSPVPSILDAYGQVKFASAFWLSGGSILMPLTRNGLQPTTTYVSIDNANVTTTPVLQGNTNVLRDLGIQANGFFLDDHIEYRLGVFQGTRQASTATQSASHNAPRFVAMVSANLWDPETGYVNGGHYFGARKVLGLMGNFDYQVLRTNAPAAAPFPLAPGAPNGSGADKNAYYGISGAAFINYPLNGPNPRGGDELVGLLQFGYYDGGLRGALPAPTNFGSYPLILKQTNYLAEAGYYNHGLRFSVFGKFEMRKISEDYPLAFRQALPAFLAPSQSWIAGGLKYYVGPANFMNFTLQYERVTNTDAPSSEQKGTNNIAFQMQTILY
jgi:hypothetical protein